jgi:hypothetical protein
MGEWNGCQNQKEEVLRLQLGVMKSSRPQLRHHGNEETLA